MTPDRIRAGIVGDAKAVLNGLFEAVSALTPPRDWHESPYTREIGAKVEAWFAGSRALRESDDAPVTMGRVITEARKVLPPEAIVLTSSGNIQAQLFQEMAFTRPRTYLSAGGFSTMGWSYPAALGAKLAKPDTPVVAMVGDGDFLIKPFRKSPPPCSTISRRWLSCSTIRAGRRSATCNKSHSAMMPLTAACSSSATSR